MKASELFSDQATMCREMLWDSGLVWLTIDRVEMRESCLPGKGKPESVACLVFRGIGPALVIKGGKRKFLVREFDTNDVRRWVGKTVGLYVDKSYRDRDGSGVGSIQLVVGDRWSGKSRPPPSKQRASRPRQSEPSADEPAPDSTPPEAIAYSDDMPSREPGEEG